MQWIINPTPPNSISFELRYLGLFKIFFKETIHIQTVVVEV